MKRSSSMSMSLSMPMMIMSITMMRVALVLLLCCNNNNVSAGGAFQSGPNVGSYYAGGLDFINDSLYVTGIAYAWDDRFPSKESSCYVSKLDSMFLQNHDTAMTSVLGDGSIMEACYGISLLHDPMDPMNPELGEHVPFVVSGIADEGGIYLPAEEDPFGFIIPMLAVPKNDQVKDYFSIQSVVSIDDNDKKELKTVSYPVTILYDFNSDSAEGGLGGQILIASLSTTDGGAKRPPPNNDEWMVDDQPNWLKYTKFGESREMTLHRYFTKPNNDKRSWRKTINVTHEHYWTRTYKIEYDPVGERKPDVDLGGMIYKNLKDHPGSRSNPDTWLYDYNNYEHGDNVLIVAGSTSGKGYGYGNAVGHDTDGFISVVSAKTGELITKSNEKSNTRIGTSENDLIFGICDSRHDPTAFYIVGTSGGIDDRDFMGSHVEGTVSEKPARDSMHAFVQKIQVDTLTPIWKRHWRSKHFGVHQRDVPSITAGIGCYVLDDGSVYVSGIVQGGATTLQDKDKNGHTIHSQKLEKDSVVAARFDGRTGDNKWFVELGSQDGTERLARHGRGGIAVDREDNLILFGDTTGSMFRKRHKDKDESSDIFLVTLSKEDGSHYHIGSTVERVPTTPPVLAPVDAAVLDEYLSSESGDYYYDDYDDYDYDEEEEGEEDLIDMTSIDWKDYGTEPDWSNTKNPTANEEEEFMSEIISKKSGLQSGPNSGSFFSGGMVYNPDEDIAYLTGIAYDDPSAQPKCIITKLPLEDSKNDLWLDLRNRKKSKEAKFGSKKVIETCSSISFHRNGEVVTVGFADTGSRLHHGNNGEEVAHNDDLTSGAGYVLALDRTNLARIDATPLATKTPNEKIQYPISVVSDGDDLYVVSLTSTDSELSREYSSYLQKMGQTKYAPNYINILKYGSSVDMTVTKVSLKEDVVDGVPDGDISFTTIWSSEFPISPDKSGNIARVFLAGAIVKKDLGYLAVAGSTSGFGRGYGRAVGDDEDGFITLLDLTTGALAFNVDRNNIREGSPEDDIVLGICDDPNDGDSAFYIVGATEGMIGMAYGATNDLPQGSMQAFLRKVDPMTLDEIWTVQLGAKHPPRKDESKNLSPTYAKAYDCVVSDDTVFVGGVVDDNASMRFEGSETKNFGLDDVWVSAVDKEIGTVLWLRQAGSAGNDRIAPHGGLAINKKGNVLLFGDTNGAFYRERAKSPLTDMFVMEFGRMNGLHKMHVAEVEEPEFQTTSVQLAPVAAPANNMDPSIKKQKNKVSTGSLVGILLAVFLILPCVSYFVCRRILFRRRSLSKNFVVGKEIEGEKIEVKDGLITNKKSSSRYKDPPPQSSFSDEQFSGDPLATAGTNDLNYSDNLYNNGKNIV